MSFVGDWRFVVTELGPPLAAGAAITTLDKIARGRDILFTLDAGAVGKCELPSDSFDVNGIHTDGDPFVNPNNRLLYAFRCEGVVGNWVLRNSGIIMQAEDEAGADQPTTHTSWFDPWQYMMSRPITRDSGTIINNVRMYKNRRYSDVVVELLANTETAHGPTWIDFGQTGFYVLDTEATDLLDIQFTQGTSVGEAMTQMVASGSIDIILKPIYDPLNRPGYLAELIIRRSVGTAKHAAVFAWDMPSRSLVGVNHMHDGAQLANKALYFTSDGDPVAVQTSAPSVAKYGQYWLQNSAGDQSAKRWVELLALADVVARKNGRETLTVDVAPERSPRPFLDFNKGDTVPVYASRRLRDPITGMYRVYAIPLHISDSGTESINGLLLTSP